MGLCQGIARLALFGRNLMMRRSSRLGRVRASRPDWVRFAEFAFAGRGNAADKPGLRWAIGFVWSKFDDPAIETLGQGSSPEARLGSFCRIRVCRRRGAADKLGVPAG